MAKNGIYKSDVKRAFEALITQNRHPSVDAIRIELGNTGSKTTIHKYLKEIEDENERVTPSSISESLQALVEQLAAQLQEESDVAVQTLKLEHAHQLTAQATKLKISEDEIYRLSKELNQTEELLRKEKTEHESLKLETREETAARHDAEKQCLHLQERLEENERHRQSIEQKHSQAREALEHYRVSMKEQRDQDERRHEHQVQQLQAELRQLQQSLIVKQEDVTRINQECVRLTSELSHLKKSLYDQHVVSNQLKVQIEGLSAVQKSNDTLIVRINEKEKLILDLQNQLLSVKQNEQEKNDQLRSLEIAVAQAEARLISQQEIMNDLRTYFDSDKTK